MSDEPLQDDNKRYWENVDAFIHHANDLAGEQGMDSVSSGLMYAAARFCAFNAATKYSDVDHLQQDKEEAVKYFTSIFRKMFDENMEEYKNNFAELVQGQSPDNMQ